MSNGKECSVSGKSKQQPEQIPMQKRRSEITEEKPVLSLAEQIKALPFWYHKIELPGGIVTPGWAPLDAKRYGIPDDLTGKRVLDIGAWDGFWTFEALKRGAKEVIAIDDFSDALGFLKEGQRRRWETFDLCRKALGFDIDLAITTGTAVTEKAVIHGIIDNCWENNKGQSVSRQEMSVYDIERLGHFDVVFFFGMIYHLRYPLLALDLISKVCDGSIYIETAQADDYSPYKGGLNKGYPDNDMVMEFYPGKQYANNEKNWWCPTLQVLCEMLKSVGFTDVDAWALTDNPKELKECRGFVSGTKDPAKEKANRPEGMIERFAERATVNVGAVMSVPRLGFHDNMSCVYEALSPLRMKVMKVQGAFWAQCLERGLEKLIDANIDLVICIDYDTVFKKKEVLALLNMMHKYPEATAIAPVQIGRGHYRMLMTLKGKSGQAIEEVPLAEFKKETTKIATSHFGLTVLRVKDLMDIPHPWFQAQPNSDGHWGPGKIDADIAFWKLLEKHGKIVLSSNRDVVGHLELMVTWPGKDGKPIYQLPSNYHKNGKPENAWA